MPLSPQITVTPDTISTKNFAISAVSFTSSTATFTATGHTFSAGDIVLITGITPDGYNGSYSINSIATNTFTVSNTTNVAATVATGDAFWASATDYEYDAYSANFLTDNNDVTTLIDSNATVANAAAQAATAAANAGTAQSTANTALDNAATAYTAAQNSLQPSAYAIQNPSTKQLSQIDATGLTVFVNSATSGPRVVLNSAGLAGYDSGGTASFSINASTGAAVFRGNITTGATITGGTMNIAGKTIIDSAGLLTGTDVTLTGEIRATAGYFGTSTNGFSVNSTGMIGVGGGVISGGIITTSTGSNAVVLDGPNNALGIKYGGTYAGWLVGIGSGAFMMHYGSSPSTTAYPRSSVSSTTASMAADGSNSLSITTSGNNMQGNMTFNSLVTLTTATVNSTIGIVGGYGITTDWSPQTDNSNTLGITGSRRWKNLYANNTTVTTSDGRLKTNVIDTPLGLSFIESLRPVSYKWIVGENEIVKDAQGNPVSDGVDEYGKPKIKTVSKPGKRHHYGFIAQEVKAALDATGVEDFAGWVQDDMNNPDSSQSLSYEQFIAPLVKAVQELSNRVKTLEGE